MDLKTFGSGVAGCATKAAGDTLGLDLLNNPALAETNSAAA